MHVNKAADSSKLQAPGYGRTEDKVSVSAQGQRGAWKGSQVRGTSATAHPAPAGTRPAACCAAREGMRVTFEAVVCNLQHQIGAVCVQVCSSVLRCAFCWCNVRTRR